MRVLADGDPDPLIVIEDGTAPLIAAAAPAARRREPGLAANLAEDEGLVLDAAKVAMDAAALPRGNR